MNTTRGRHTILVLSLLILGSVNLSAQSKDFFKQMINESLHKDFLMEMFESSESQSMSDSLPDYLNTIHGGTEVIELNVNKMPIPKLGYNFKFNTLLIQSMEKSMEFPNLSETTEKMLASYTNPKYNPKGSKINQYQGLMPGNIYNNLSGKGLVNISQLAQAASSKLNSGKEGNRSTIVRFTEFEKEGIVEKTNQLIWEMLYADYSNTENDSTSVNFLFRKDSLPQAREFRNPPNY